MTKNAPLECEEDPFFFISTNVTIITYTARHLARLIGLGGWPRPLANRPQHYFQSIDVHEAYIQFK